MSVNHLDEIHAEVAGGNMVELYQSAVKLQTKSGAVAGFEPTGDISLILPNTSTIDYNDEKGIRVATHKGDYA